MIRDYKPGYSMIKFTGSDMGHKVAVWAAVALLPLDLIELPPL